MRMSVPVRAAVLIFAVTLSLFTVLTHALGVNGVNSTGPSLRRLLRDAGDSEESFSGLRALDRFNSRKALAKAERMKRVLGVINSRPNVVGDLEPEAWGAKHKSTGPAIFAVALNYEDTSSTKFDAQKFVGTARKSGFTGDIVLALSPGYNSGFMGVVKKNKCVVYTIETVCDETENKHDSICTFKSQPQFKASVNMIRFYLYQFWASQYKKNAMIMIADFRDVLFQGNPFTFETHLWMPPAAQLVVFQEAYPNKVINRCPFNSGWISSCYGEETMQKIGTNTVSCSGVTIGTRDALLVYTYLITQQLDPKVRYGKDSTKTNKGCISAGMDQGFHNWLVYSGILDRYMDVKIFQQGEGPVNTVGGFFPGDFALLKFNLTTWKVLRGEGEKKYFANWNGKPSPVVHQYDRFIKRDLGEMLKDNLAVLQTIDI
jgi:hypothetical protein